HGGRRGQVLLERVHSLVDERDAVGQKQHTFYPVTSHEQIAKRDNGAGFPRARRHHDQRLSLLILLESFTDSTDCSCLVEPFDDLGINLCWPKRQACIPPLNE